MFRFNHHHQGAYYLSYAKVIQGVPGGTCQTSGGCSLC